jgi:hypothetical protein
MSKNPYEGTIPTVIKHSAEKPKAEGGEENKGAELRESLKGFNLPISKFLLGLNPDQQDEVDLYVFIDGIATYNQVENPELREGQIDEIIEMINGLLNLGENETVKKRELGEKIARTIDSYF